MAPVFCILEDILWINFKQQATTITINSYLTMVIDLIRTPILEPLGKNRGFFLKCGSA